MVLNLIIRDEQGHKKKIAFDVKIDFLDLATAFNSVFRKHASIDNTTFVVERPDHNETLRIETAVGILTRQRGEDPPQYSRWSNRPARLQEVWTRFAVGGYDGIDYLPDWMEVEWVNDRESILPDDSYVDHELADAEARRQAAAQRKLVRSLPKLDRKALKRFCEVWADGGSNEYDDDWYDHYVLFDGGRVEEDMAERDDALRIVADLGLIVDELPADAPEGSVWVRTDPRVDIELEK